MAAFLDALSQLFGWIYTISWSLSFYPQPILNFRRKSTSGTTIDFPTINILGFLAYFISNAAFLYSPVIREQYAARNHGLTPTVEFNDLAFAGHAVILSVLTYTQFFPWIWGFDKKGRRGIGATVSRSIMGICIGCVVGVVVTTLNVALNPQDDARKGWAWIDVIYAVSYVKIIVTLVKYMPQVLTNYRNHSTYGWSIEQILLDFLGGILSLSQLAIDSYLQRDWSGLTGNPVKFALGNLAIIFDIVFMIQHYWLYRGAGEKEVADAEIDEGSEEDPLLANGRGLS